MATKQWIGIEEAATKYQVSTRRIITCLLYTSDAADE